MTELLEHEIGTASPIDLPFRCRRIFSYENMAKTLGLGTFINDASSTRQVSLQFGHGIYYRFRIREILHRTKTRWTDQMLDDYWYRLIAHIVDQINEEDFAAVEVEVEHVS